MPKVVHSSLQIPYRLNHCCLFIKLIIFLKLWCIFHINERTPSWFGIGTLATHNCSMRAWNKWIYFFMFSFSFNVCNLYFQYFFVMTFWHSNNLLIHSMYHLLFDTWLNMWNKILFKKLLIIARDLMSLSSQLFPLPMLVVRNAWVLIVIWIVVEETNLIYILLIIDQTFSF
jgi:hypothetical protein